MRLNYRLLVLTLLAVVSLGLGTSAQASTLTFEGAGNCNLLPGGQCNPNAQGYGLRFTQIGLLTTTPPDTLGLGSPTGYDVAAVSPFNVLFRGSCFDGIPVCDGQISMIDKTFNFLSGYFTGTFRDGQTVTITGFRSGSVVADFTSSFLVNTSAPVFQTFSGWTNLAYVNIATSGGALILGLQEGPGNYRNSVAMDNLDIELVPEPSAVALIALALLWLFGLGMLRRRADV